MYEELLLSKSPVKTKHPKIFRSNEPFIELDDLKVEIDLIEKMIRVNDLDGIVQKLKKLVSDYSPNSMIVDHTYNFNNMIY